jgi:DNA-directed RNA polymerase subunit K/omega
LIIFDLDKLNEKFQNKFYLVLAIVDRVKALKRGLQPVVDQRGLTLITTAIEELETDHLSWEVRDEYLPPHRLEGFDVDEAGLADDEAEVEEVDAVFAELPALEGEFIGAGGKKGKAVPAVTEEGAQAAPKA